MTSPYFHAYVGLTPRQRRVVALLLVFGAVAASSPYFTASRIRATLLSSTAAYDAECTAPQPQAMLRGCAVLPAIGSIADSAWNTSEDFKSQFEEDKYVLENYFFGVRGGSFLEMGALDGVRYSNTYFFEKSLDWSGLLIEGSPNNYRGLRTRRPASVTVNAMVCDKPGVVHMLDNSAVGGVYEFMSEEFRKRWHPNVDMSKLPEIPCVPMHDLLQRYGVRHVDLFSLDVEGAEAAVLSTVDFSEFSASVIVMEWDETPAYSNALARLQRAGYVVDDNKGLHRRNIVLLHPAFKKKLDKLRASR